MAKLLKIIWITAQYIQRKVLQKQFGTSSNSFPVAKYFNILQIKIDHKKLLNVKFCAFLRVTHFHTIFILGSEFHEEIQDYTYAIVNIMLPQVSKLVRKH